MPEDLKTSSLHIRPIYHRLNHRVKAHMFLCMLAYYVEWHLRKLWTPLLLVNIPNNKDSSSSSKEYTESNQEENQESEEKDSYHTLLSHMNYH